MNEIGCKYLEMTEDFWKYHKMTGNGNKNDDNNVNDDGEGSQGMALSQF